MVDVLFLLQRPRSGASHVNAAEQRRDANSFLNWTERIIRMRKEVPEIGWGQFKILRSGDNAVLALRYDWRNNSVLFLHNLADEPREVVFSTGLPAETRWYRVGGLDYLLKRSEI